LPTRHIFFFQTYSVSYIGEKRDISKQDYVHLADSYDEQQT